MKLGFIGYGRVGEATAGIFSANHEILWYDKYKEQSNPLKEVVEKSDVMFLALPTPADFEGLTIDLSIIDEAVKEIDALAASREEKPVLVIKSTVVPGTTLGYEKQHENIRFMMSPEYLTDANYKEDARNPDRLVFGTNDEKAEKLVLGLYKERFPNVKMFTTNPTSAELAKYANNIFLIYKLVFANTMQQIAENLSETLEPVDYNNEIQAMVAADSRIGKSHLHVTKEKGYGGKCFPKDLVAMIGLLQEKRYAPEALNVLKELWDYNLKVRSVKDWEEIAGAVAQNTHELYSQEN